MSTRRLHDFILASRPANDYLGYPQVSAQDIHCHVEDHGKYSDPYFQEFDHEKVHYLEYLTPWASKEKKRSSLVLLTASARAFWRYSYSGIPMFEFELGSLTLSSTGDILENFEKSFFYLLRVSFLR